jgi:hypothetical protein
MFLRQCKDVQAVLDIILHPLSEFLRDLFVFFNTLVKPVFGRCSILRIKNVPDVFGDLPPHRRLRNMACGVSLQMTLTSLPSYAEL